MPHAAHSSSDSLNASQRIRVGSKNVNSVSVWPDAEKSANNGVSFLEI